MKTLLKISNQNSFKKNHIFEYLIHLYDQINSLKSNESKLKIDELVDKLKTIKNTVIYFRSSLRKTKYERKSELLIKFEPKNYFDKVLKILEGKSTNFNLNINLAEAIDSLYDNLEIIENFKINHQDINLVLNIIGEILLDLEQHFVYHVEETKKHYKIN